MRDIMRMFYNVDNFYCNTYVLMYKLGTCMYRIRNGKDSRGPMEQDELFVEKYCAFREEWKHMYGLHKCNKETLLLNGDPFRYFAEYSINMTKINESVKDLLQLLSYEMDGENIVRISRPSAIRAFSSYIGRNEKYVNRLSDDMKKL